MASKTTSGWRWNNHYASYGKPLFAAASEGLMRQREVKADGQGHGGQAQVAAPAPPRLDNSFRPSPSATEKPVEKKIIEKDS
jgi:hypothetical protein